MTMDHKAFLFDYSRFERELKPMLEEALSSGNCDALVLFIQQQLPELKDPYEGEPLDENWATLIETPDAHQYGDFALTKYYDPADDIGLGLAWDEIQNELACHTDLTASPILGSTIGPEENLFDPGKMGAYFQSEEQVCQSCDFLTAYENENFQSAIEMLSSASDSNKGLYVTF